VRVVLAPDSFKGTAAAADVVDALASGWRAVRPGDEIVGVPLADGGEGTIGVVRAAHRDATWHDVTVAGPLRRPVDAGWLQLPDGTAIVELAMASGLPLLDEPDPLGSHTQGLGQVIGAALDAGAHSLLIALGGSASTDGGTAALAALGARFLDDAGRALPLGGGSLARLNSIVLDELRPAPPGGVRCLTDVTSPLLGPDGAAATFGPQKGATARDVARLAEGLTRLARLLGGQAADPGAGAAGGTAYGLAAAWGAELVPGAAAMSGIAGLAAAVEGADLVITGEGRFDAASTRGKVVSSVVCVSAEAGVDVHLVAGQISAPLPPPIRRALALTDLAGNSVAAQQDARKWLLAAGELLARQFTNGDLTRT
jgi:glycerate kinase